MSDIPLRALTRKYRSAKTGGYAPLNGEEQHTNEQHNELSGSDMAVARAAASSAANYNAKKKGKGKQQRYRDDDAEEEENLLRRGEYEGDDDGDEPAEEAALLRRELSVDSVSCVTTFIHCYLRMPS